MLDQMVHEELSVERVSALEPLPAGGDGLCVWATVASDKEPSVELEVRLTHGALSELRDRDPREFIGERILKFTGSFENDGRKLWRLASMSPISLHSDHVDD